MIGLNAVFIKHNENEFEINTNYIIGIDLRTKP